MNNLQSCVVILYEPSSKGHLQSLEILIKYGAEIDFISYQTEDTALIEAYREGGDACVKILLDNGANATYSSPFDKTALIQASKSGHLKCVQILLRHRTNNGNRLFDTSEMQISTALEKVAANGHYKCLKILLKSKPHDLTPALMQASQRGYQISVKILLRSGALLNSTSNTGTTALELAATSGDMRCLSILIGKELK